MRLQCRFAAGICTSAVSVGRNRIQLGLYSPSIGDTTIAQLWRDYEPASPNGADNQRRKIMTQTGLTKIVIAISTFAGAALLSFGWSEQRGLSLSVEKAEARVGRPLTPVSVAGVARRQHRRAAYGAGVVGAGAAAVGTAAAIGTAGAIAATSPNWGWGGNPYQTGTGYYAGGPYYGGSVQGARAAYYGGYQSAAWGGLSSGDRDLYFRNLRDSGYDKKGDFNSNGTIRNQ
jgi:hypothetical protein